jgi:hypothetical protein
MTTIIDRQILAPAGRWAEIRTDLRFAPLIRFGRVTNSLSLAYGPLLHTLADQSPRARRERFAAFFYRPPS